jgi:hypothetical protein
MNHEKIIYIEKFRETLNKVYEVMAEDGDASLYDKGIVKGMMVAGRALNVVTVEELSGIINQERLSVFNSTKRPVIDNARIAEKSFWESGMNKEVIADKLETWIDTPISQRGEYISDRHKNNIK